MPETRELWEVLVPCQRNDGRAISTRFHRIWDGRVREITGGLTVLRPAQGQWVDPADGTLYHERMIPVRIAVERRADIRRIIDMTADYYEQIAVMAYLVSSEVIIYENPRMRQRVAEEHPNLGQLQKVRAPSAAQLERHRRQVQYGKKGGEPVGS